MTPKRAAQTEAASVAKRTSREKKEFTAQDLERAVAEAVAQAQAEAEAEADEVARDAEETAESLAEEAEESEKALLKEIEELQTKVGEGGGSIACRTFANFPP